MNGQYSKRIMNIAEAKEVLENAGLTVEADEDRFVRATITKMVNDFPYKSRNKALVHDPKKRDEIEAFIRNYYNSMPSVDDCIERLYAEIEKEEL